ncbi:SRPBCC family protein [Roseibium sp.]|uniref:SRPBCC family protein n=1 Tax=Roseibium sp. TaxID=1936156 RepID=UPI003B50F964
MKICSTSIEISATADKVWSALTRDLQHDPVPFGILKIEGTLSLNSRIRLWSEVDPKRAFRLRVKAFQAPGKMVWQGGMPLGLFTGTRTFSLSAIGDKTVFEMEEVYSGVLSNLIVKTVPDLTPSFEKFANALKERAERNE